MVRFLLSIFKIIGNMCGKSYITLYKSSVCLGCKHPNIRSRGMTVLLMAKHQGHIGSETGK